MVVEAWELVAQAEAIVSPSLSLKSDASRERLDIKLGIDFTVGLLFDCQVLYTSMSLACLTH